VAALVFLVPSFVRPAPAFWPWRQPIRLGLDLQGGTHLLYGVDIDQAIDNTVDRQLQNLERVLREEQIGAASVERKGRTIQLQLANKDKRAQVEELVKDRFPNLVAVPEPDAEAGDLAYTLEPREGQRLRDNVQEQALKIIRNRIDQFGVAEPTVQAQGTDEIVVQLPGVLDPQGPKGLIGPPGPLRFQAGGAGAGAGDNRPPGPKRPGVPGKSEKGRR